MTQITNSRWKQELVMQKDWLGMTFKQVEALKQLTAEKGTLFCTNKSDKAWLEAAMVKVIVYKGETYALLLKAKELRQGKYAMITFYRDTSGDVLKRIRSGQWTRA